VTLSAGAFACGGDDDKGGTATNGDTTTGAGATATGEETTTGEKTKGGGETGKLPSAVKVDAVDFAFQPANPRVKAGTVTFRIRNRGTFVHAVKVEVQRGEERSKDIVPRKSARLRVKLDKPGTYTWYCPIGTHRKLGMKGKIMVGGSS
jgi:plastocyanin